MPEREDRQPAQVAAREQVDHAEQRALHLVEELGQGVAVDARRRHVGAHPVGDEQDGGDQDPALELGDLEDVLERLQAFDHEAVTFSLIGSTSTRPPWPSILARADSLTACTRTVRVCGDVTVAEDLHPPALGALDQPGLREPVGIDHAAGREAAQRLEVHDGVLRLAAEGQEAALGQAAVERHLAALEAAALAAARAGPLALVALGRRLAVAGAGPAADALAPLDGAGRRTQIVKLHGSPGARAAPWRSCRGSSACRRGSPGGASAAGPSALTVASCWGSGRSCSSSG